MSKSLRIAAIALLAMGVLGAQTGTAPRTAPATGISNKAPVFGGACKLCPWGAMAQVVRNAMRFYGYDVKICYNCNAVDSTRIVSGARLPPPYKKDPAVSEAMAPYNAEGLGPVDFGSTAQQFLCDAYHGTGPYAKDPPMKNLRLLANIQAPWFLVVAAKADTGITDLSQVRAKRWPVRIYASPTDTFAKQVLSFYGLSVEDIDAAGGHVGSAKEDRANFDVIIQGGAGLSTAPEWNVLAQASERSELNYMELPETLLAKMAEAPHVERGYLPVGLLPGIERPIPTIVRNGEVVYTRSDVPDSFAYDVARALDEHQDELQWTNQNFSYNVHTVGKACDVPLHPGAARYYKQMHYMR